MSGISARIRKNMKTERFLKTKDWNPLEMETIEEKYYAPGVGVVLEVTVKDGSERVELISITTE